MVSYSDFVSDPLFNSYFADTDKYPGAFVTALLSYTEDELLDCYWGKYQVRAIKLLTAHRLEKYTKAGVIGSATSPIPAELKQYLDPTSIVSSLSASQGSNSVSFSPSSRSSEAKELNHSGIAAGEDLTSTIWGQMFLSIPATQPLIGFVL